MCDCSRSAVYMSGGRPGGGRPRLVRVALFGLFRFCHPLRHDVLCSTWMGPGDRRYELRWIPSSPRSKGKPSSRILKMDFACLPPHPPRQGKAKFPDITLGLVLERSGRGACSLAPTVQYTGTQPCASEPEIGLPSRISGSAVCPASGGGGRRHEQQSIGFPTLQPGLLFRRYGASWCPGVPVYSSVGPVSRCAGVTAF